MQRKIARFGNSMLIMMNIYIYIYIYHLYQTFFFGGNTSAGIVSSSLALFSYTYRVVVVDGDVVLAASDAT